MPNRTYRVRVLFPETPERKKYTESFAHGFTIQARTHDVAAIEARARVMANGFIVRSVAHSPENVLVVHAHDPKTMAMAVRA